MRKSVLALILILSIVTCYAYKIGHHYITVEINREGFAKVTERYYLGFESEQAINEFAKIKTKLGQNIKEWAEFDRNFSIHVGGIAKVDAQSVRVSFSTVKDYYLEISYALTERVVNKVSEKGRMQIYELNKWVFKPYISAGGDYVIPEGTFITIILPKESTLIEEGELFNYAIVERTEDAKMKIMLQGYRALGSMSFRYIIWKSLAPPISISMGLKKFYEWIKTPENSAVFIVILLIITGFLYIKRNKIKNSIKKFIVAHTEFSGEANTINEKLLQ